jgi:YidC/Oxa1 family membrane protein insertase
MFDFIIIPFLNVLVFTYQLIGENFGWAIILFTILVRLAIFPFTRSQLDMSSKMSELQSDPEWQKIQKKYEKDKEKLAQEQMRVYQERGINPLGSCLPTLIQLPLIIALYSAITRAMAASPIQLLQLINELSLGEKFKLVPLNSSFLWMDLSQPERFPLSFIPENWPIIGAGIPILAILVMITSYFQTKLMTPAPSTGKANDQTANMTRMMGLYMPLFMGWISYQYAAGLALYFVISNLMSVVQYAVMGKLNLSNLIPRLGSGPSKK